ncbi:MAG: hypothetical protein ACI83P_001036 [Janthinobacterium sp.]|jgi:hypothetical protein
MNENEKKVMAIYRETRLPSVFIGVPSTTNHLAWSLLAIVVGLILWLTIAVTHAENQRNALMTRVCQDRVFDVELDRHCLAFVQTRDHWWQHVYYALSHVR